MQHISNKSSCTILILTYKGIHHLKFLLPTVRTLIENSKNYTINVLIVDNGADETTKKFVETNYSEFPIVPSQKNDYLFSLNYFVSKIKTPYVYILNDDMKLDPEAINASLPLLENDQRLFSVGSNILDWEGKYETIGIRILEYTRGWARNFFIEIPDDKVRYTLYGGGGAAIFRVDKFNILKGFSPLYRPAYAEDCDLGHRAWKRGWPTIIQPKSKIYHREGGTIHEQFASDDLTQKTYKNTFLWMIRNIDFPKFLFAFFMFLPIRMFKWRKTTPNLYKAAKMALPQLHKALMLRIIDRGAIIKDKELIKLLNTPYEFNR